jgi:p-hydroxybenzoate 3-monooxygenase
LQKSDVLLDSFSATALARVWKAIRFSWWMTNLLHKFPTQSEFDQRIQESELDYISTSPTAQASLAENYTGLGY